MKIPQTLAGRVVILFGVLALFVALAVGGAYALGFGPWAEGGGDDEASDAPFTPTRTDDGAVIAKVDGTPIHMVDAESRVEGLASMHGDVEGTLGEDWPDEILQSLVDDVLILAEADRRGIVVTEGDIDRSIGRIQGMVETEEAFESWLRDQGTTLSELQQRVWLQTVAARVYLAVTEDVSISQAELREYFRTHKDEFRSEEGWVIPFLSVRDTLREDMLKEKQDEAYTAWLEEARAGAEVLVLDDGWWRDVG